MMFKKRRQRQDRTGAAAVEFALAFPILFLTILVVFEFGWQVIIRHTADNAAYEASRAAIVPGGTADDARSEADRIMRMVGARNFQINVEPRTISESTPEVEVSVTGFYSDNGIVVSKFLQGVGFRSDAKLLTERPRRD